MLDIQDDRVYKRFGATRAGALYHLQAYDQNDDEVPLPKWCETNYKTREGVHTAIVFCSHLLLNTRVTP